MRFIHRYSLLVILISLLPDYIFTQTHISFKDPVINFAFTNDGEQVIILRENNLELWHVTGYLVRTFKNPGLTDFRYNDFKISPGSDFIGCIYSAPMYQNKFLRIWNLETGFYLGQVALIEKYITAMEFDSEGETLFIATIDGSILQYEVKSLLIKNDFSAHKNRINSIRCTPDNKYIISSTDDKITKMDLNTGELEWLYNSKSIDINNINISKNGRYLLGGLSDGSILMWDMISGEIIQKITGNESAIISLDINADESLIISGSKDNTLKFWDTKDGYLVRTYYPHNRKITNISFNKDGSLFATSSIDGNVKIWKSEFEIKGLAIQTDNEDIQNKATLNEQPFIKSKVEVPTMDPAEISAPEISSTEIIWTSPESVYQNTNYPYYTVSATVRSNTGLSDISIFLNNTLISIIKDFKLSDNFFSCYITEDVNLIPGVNNIRIKVLNENKSQYTENRIVNYTEKITERRLALVIGNDKYTYGGTLNNPFNDALDIADSLKKVGFDVMSYYNTDQRSLKMAIDEFGEKLENYDVGLFYYAGHGIQVKGINYIIPVDANLLKEQDVEYDCVEIGRILGKMEAAENNTNIIILDACRDNPFERRWGGRSARGSGLAFMTAPSGSLIAYSTSPGKTASDGYERNGLYTGTLLKYINIKDLQIEELFKAVRSEVESKSNGIQTPWESTSLKGKFYFIR